MACRAGKQRAKFFPPQFRESALTVPFITSRLRPVFRTGSTELSNRLVTTLALALCYLGGSHGKAAVPFTEATVTRLQNKVTYGVNAEQRRPAAVQDVIRERNFLLTEIDARAELKYPDGTIVRLGQNTIFSFQAETRTLELKQGALIFYVPDNKGGGVIKTPSLTAAITGTVAVMAVDKVKKTELIAMHEHSVTLSTGRVIPEGQFVRRNPDGSLTFDFFDREKARTGLFVWGGVLPPFRQALLTGIPNVDFLAGVKHQEELERTAIYPGALGNFFPLVNVKAPADEKTTQTFVPPAQITTVKKRRNPRDSSPGPDPDSHPSPEP
ncbi:MAG: hypothetical protein QOE70_6252 [Chthoniobacter sp.]|jgi:hypothetical protein|nr:hypothetical protein [Chthoniobacter sp.]